MHNLRQGKVKHTMYYNLLKQLQVFASSPWFTWQALEHKDKIWCHLLHTKGWKTL